MAEGIEPIASWTFMREIDLPSDISSILIDGSNYKQKTDHQRFPGNYGQEDRNVFIAVEFNQYVVIRERWFYGHQF